MAFLAGQKSTKEVVGGDNPRTPQSEMREFALREGPDRPWCQGSGQAFRYIFACGSGKWAKGKWGSCSRPTLPSVPRSSQASPTRHLTLPMSMATPICISAGPPELGQVAQTGIRDRHDLLTPLWSSIMITGKFGSPPLR